jgi:heptosyltransferase-2
VVLAGQLSLLQSAALMSKAKRNFVNDSGPLHLCSAMDAPVTAVFCSTIPSFGFGPLSKDSKVVQTALGLACRPCGLHGRKECPEGHFKCGTSINTVDLLNTIQ